MGILDGAVASLFGEVFGNIYLDGVLFKAERTEGLEGSVVQSFKPYDMKAQHDGRTRSSDPAQGNAPLTAAIIMLAQHNGVELPEPVEGDHCLLQGTRYVIGAGVARDPCGSHYRLPVTQTSDTSHG